MSNRNQLRLAHITIDVQTMLDLVFGFTSRTKIAPERWRGWARDLPSRPLRPMDIRMLRVGDRDCREKSLSVWMTPLFKKTVP
jgi:hypothetical protein